MVHCKQMTIFQNLDRSRTLVKFKKLTETYFANVDQGAFGLEVKESIIAKRTRSQLNLGLEKVKRAFWCVDIHPRVAHARRHPLGEPSGEIDLLENLFRLHQHRVSSQILLDYVDRAIGVYKDDRSRAWMRTINPFYWLNLLLECTARLPFFVLGSMGLDRARMEASSLGRFFKGSLRVAALLALLFGTVHYLGYLEPIKSGLRGPLANLKLNGQEILHRLEQRTDAFLLKLQGSSPESRPEEHDPAT